MANSRRIFLGLGSNIGDRAGHLASARLMLKQNFGQCALVSSVYETAAWGIEEQGAFLNQVIAFDTTRSPKVVFERIAAIEKKLGRVRKYKWGPRTIDIDLLFHGKLKLNSLRLTIPHPRIADRKFVLVPMEEIAADFLHPVFEKSIKALNLDCTDHQKVNKLE